MKTFLIVGFALMLAALSSRAQTNITVQPGLNILATNAIDAQDAVVNYTNHAPSTFSVYDAADVSQFTISSNAVDVIVAGAPVRPPKITTDLTPVIGPITISTNAQITVHARHYNNGIVLLYRGSGPVTLTLTNLPPVAPPIFTPVPSSTPTQ
jgi:hypothetical protein